MTTTSSFRSTGRALGASIVVSLRTCVLLMWGSLRLVAEGGRQWPVCSDIGPPVGAGARCRASAARVLSNSGLLCRRVSPTAIAPPACKRSIRGKGVQSLAGPLASLSTGNSTARGRATMTKHAYETELTALLVIDPYNDFISEGGKLWDRIRAVAEANNCVPHMLQVLNAARKARLRIFYVMHHRYRPGDYETWTYIAP